MKLFLPVTLLVLTSLSESTDAFTGVRDRRRLDACGVVNEDYGSGNNLDKSRGNSDIKVEKGNSATCTVTCTSASNLELYIGYGSPGSQDKGNADASNTAMSCGDSLEATNSNGDAGFEFIVVASSYQNLKVECGCPTDDQQGPGGCFSGTDTVQVLNRGETAMKDLEVGDKVLTGTGAYEPVYSFGHYHEKQVSNFVQLETKQGDSLTLTPDHLIFANGDKSNSIRADKVQVGDKLSSGAVEKVTTVSKQGLYMPLTPSGKLLVNNVEASAYVSLSAYAPIQEHPLLNFWLTEQNLVHLWLAPYRMYCMGVKSNYCPGHVKNTDGEEGILGYLVMGKKVAEVALEQNLFVQVILGVLVFGTLMAFRAVEILTGPALAPVAALLLGVWFFQLRRATGGQEKKKSL
jgi:Hint module